MKKLTVVKIGGNIIDNPEALSDLLDRFNLINMPKILVHGGGKTATTIAQSMGMEVNMIDGRRVTDKNMLKVVTMVYAGLINKNIVAQLQYRGTNAIGLCGADGGLIPAIKRASNPVDYGFVGDPCSINVEMINSLLNSGLSLIIAPLTYSNGEILNTNADTIAQIIATSLAKEYRVELHYIFEKRGVLRDIKDSSSLIDVVTPSIFEDLKQQGIVSEGMLPKLTNALTSVSQGVKTVFIGETKICNSI